MIPLIIFVVFCWTHSSMSSSYLRCTEEPSTEPSTPDVPHQCWAEGNDHLPWPTAPSWAHISPILLLLICLQKPFLLPMCPQKPFLLPFMFVAIQFQMYFGFVNPPLHARTVSLYSYNEYLPCIATTWVYSKIPFKEAKNRTSYFNFSFQFCGLQFYLPDL